MSDYRIPTIADVEELSFVPVQREEIRRRQYDLQMSELFSLYEKEDSGLCDVGEVGTIIRAMNLNPSEALVTSIIESIEEPESTGYVSLSKLRNVLMEIKMTGQYMGTVLMRDSEETIIKAFQMLDREKKGYIEEKDLREVMTTMGEKFSAEEMLEMINAAQDPDSGHIYYEDFAPILATE